MKNYYSKPLPHLFLLMLCFAAGAVIVGGILTFLPPLFEMDSAASNYWMLLIQNIGMFLLPAYCAMRMVRRHALMRLGLRRLPKIGSILCLLILMLLIMPFISLTYGLNAALPLPDWAVEMEHKVEESTLRILITDNWHGFWLNMLLIALMPAAVEEIFFRGFIQKTLHRLFGNAHWAIFVSAAVFSAFHLQFLSFLPRLFLGIVLGYLCHWSRSLWLPIAAHFINNAMAIGLYFYIGYNHLPNNVDNLDAIIQSKTLFAAIATLTALLILSMIYYFENKRSIDLAISKMEA